MSLILADIELRAEIDAGRLVFDPALEDRQIQSASIDLKLHDVFWHPNFPQGQGMEFTVDIGTATAYQYFDRSQANELVLEPQEFVLGETAEAITIPRHLAAWIEGKSGRARHGLIVHCTAPHIAPGWGLPKPKRITLELVNLGPARIRIKAGVAIAQLVLTRLSSPSVALYSGQHTTMGS